jgi:hypothetical protein
VCVYEQDPEFTATPQSGGTIKWYDGGGAYVKDGTTLSPVRPIGMQYPITIQYFASQVVNGCEGDKIGKSYKINKKPENPIVTGAAVCEGATTIPVLTTNLPQDKWYGDAAATDYRATAISYAPDAAEVGSSSKTYYVVRVLNGCSSDTVPVTLSVVPIPTFEIDPKYLLRCQSDKGEILKAIKLNPDYHTNTTVSGGKIEWFQKGLKRSEGDIYTVDTSLFLPGYINNITARYSVFIGNKVCKSQEVLMQYDVRRIPRVPIINTLPVCLGEYSTQADIFEVNIMSMSDQLEWSSPLLHNGSTQYSRKISINGEQLQEIGVGRIPITIIARDKDIAECKSVYEGGIQVSPMPDSKIIGKDKVCEGKTEEFYSVEHGDVQNNYKWEITGKI